MFSKHTTLYLRISEAKNLLSKDLNGKSDPYCVLKVDNEVIARTVTVYKSLEPLWGEEFTLHMPCGFRDLAIYVYDEDRVSGDDIIGTISITKQMIHEQKTSNGLERWFPLLKANKDLEIQGEILLEYGIRSSENMSSSHLVLTVVEGRDLAPKDKTGYSDPYITIECLDQSKTTSSQKKTRFPEWHETFTFLLPSADVDFTVTITVMDKDRIRSDDFMGRIHLRADDIPEGSTTRKWHSVAHKTLTATEIRRCSKIDRGKLRLKLQLLEELVLPSSCYNPITDLLFQAIKLENYDLGMYIWPTLAKNRTLELSEVAGSLIRFSLSHDVVVDFLDRVTRMDVEGTANPNTLFRGNTLATKSMDQFMKIVGMPYLHHTLSNEIDRIFSEKKAVELDPHRVNSVRRRHSIHRESEENILQSSQEVLEGYMGDIMERIIHSARDCPHIMRVVFRNLQMTVRKKWPETEYEDIPYLAVSGFLFLRFFAPAILSPKLFSLHPVHANRKISRTLTLLAKLTQSMGNLNVQGKEAWLEPLAPLIHNYVGCVREFIDDLVTVFDSDKNHRCSGLSPTHQKDEVILRHGVLLKCRYKTKSWLRPLVFKKCNFWLTRSTLSYTKSQSEEARKVIPVSQVCAVEKLDYGALSKSNMGQILIRDPEDTNNVDYGILYFQAKDVNELTSWMSAIRKTCQFNQCRVEAYHPGVYKGDKWSCCHRLLPTATGCSQTYHGVMLGDWQDPLDPRLETQIIFSQLLNSRDNLRKEQIELQLELTRRGAEGSVGCVTSQGQPIDKKLKTIGQILDVIEQLTMSHETFREMPELHH
ncbi:LOW QUALITY PROTEIN: rasGAP-activating-like protein 1 [Haliotis rubra]|uniref:LOW QUALITY PROTEIN: rasGAP-activating-like protein 1 n=1 Tax=Haliotis rubra TaxID=36100 RepID=UPI001EE606CB|nr:LOW QUALITY PROTEIN: rasGAP-activating-like protein 1 [Haliotis rubra]